jgi:hypothetical protein
VNEQSDKFTLIIFETILEFIETFDYTENSYEDFLLSLESTIGLLILDNDKRKVLTEIITTMLKFNMIKINEHTNQFSNIIKPEFLYEFLIQYSSKNKTLMNIRNDMIKQRKLSSNFIKRNEEDKKIVVTKQGTLF